jgi:hypothetical protein
MRKLKGVSVFNTIEALGIVPGNSEECLELDRILALWGQTQYTLPRLPIEC